MLTRIDLVYQTGSDSAQYTTFNSYNDLFDVYPVLEQYFTEDLMCVDLLEMTIKDDVTIIRIDAYNVQEDKDLEEGGIYGNEFGN
jgi:hypothetical protein